MPGTVPAVSPGPPLPAPATESVFDGTRHPGRSRCPLQGEVGLGPDLGLHPQNQENGIPAKALLPFQTHELEERTL